MPDLVTRLRLDSSQYNTGIDSAKQKTQELQDTADDASKSLKDMGDKGAKSAKDLLKEMSNLEHAGRSASNYRKQLGEIQKQIVDLTVGYRNMSKEMQQSDIGREVAAKIQELTAEAASYKDTIMDVQQEVKNLASDTAVWDGMKMGIDTVSSSLQAFVSSGVLGEKTTEDLVAVIAKLQAIEKTTAAVIKIGNMLQKNSAAVQAIVTLQTKLSTNAKLKEAAATGTLTVAQRALNAVMKANPVLLLVSALVAAGSAIYLLTKKTTEAADAANIAKKRTDEFRKSLNEAKGEAGAVIGKFSALQQQYKLLQSEAEKQQWIKDNKKNFEELNLSIKNVNDADDVFIKNAAKVVRAMQLRAEASAMMATYEAQYAEAYKESLKLQEGKQSAYMASSTYRKEWKNAGLSDEDVSRSTMTMPSTVGAVSMSTYTLTESGRKKLDAYYENLGKEALTQFENGAAPIFKDIQNKLAEATKLENEVGHFGKNNDNGGGGDKNKNDEIQALEGSKKAVQDLISKTQALRDAQVVGTEEWIKQNEALKELQGQLDEIIGKEKRLTSTPLEPLELPVTPVLEGKVEYKPEGIKMPIRFSPADMAKAYQDAQQKAGEISQWVKVGAITPQQAAVMIDSLNKQLEAAGITAKVELELDTSKAVKQMDAFVAKMDQVGSVGNAVGAINSVYESISQLGDKLSEAQNGWEAFFALFQTGMTIFNAVATIIETVATVTELLTAAKTANAAATTSETAATVTGTAATVADTGATITNAAAHGAAAAAEGGESVASIPYVGPILAIAAIAAVMGAIIGILASAKGFANGGIAGMVNAPSRIGDHNIIAVNGGEMILNERQQANLFKMLDEGKKDRESNFGGNVEFKVRGTELVGVLNNINKKNSKI